MFVPDEVRKCVAFVGYQLANGDTAFAGTVFEGRSHLLPAQRGWEEIADYALSWAERHVVSLAEHGA